MPGPILVWRFHDAPKELRELSTNGGDEDWLAHVPKEMAKDYIPWLDAGMGSNGFGSCDISKYELEDGSVVYIGDHA